MPLPDAATRPASAAGGWNSPQVTAPGGPIAPPTQAQTDNMQGQMTPGYSWLQQFGGLFADASASANQGIASQLDALGGQLGLNQANYQAQSGYLNQDMQNQLAQLGIQGQQIGVNQQSLAQQQNVFEPQSYGLQQQSLADQITGAKQGFNRGMQDTGGGLAASGATNTVGAGRQYNDLVNRYAQQLGTSSDPRFKQLGAQQYAGQLPTEQKQAALGHQEAQFGYGQQGKQLDLQAKSLGISKQEVNDRTQQALQQLGLSTMLNAGDIYKAMGDAQAGAYNPIQSLLGDIYQISGLSPVVGT